MVAANEAGLGPIRAPIAAWRDPEKPQSQDRALYGITEDEEGIFHPFYNIDPDSVNLGDYRSFDEAVARCQRHNDTGA